ncbi:limonene-1,2-epoxide hydrolase family protein [Mycobacterium sp. NAZ190054]|uniref:limonene-1,2-epoxide hydrolase family protein n=1 Tax=Mycobacterium sp. NAZ190054 TaxID=1747766 RepID=UPI00079B4E71|nr:limonene-1,2-epoxide hydrolase family protein [Mycobacterium sp. NAZ190054]KWX60535.1 limonene-1,2-epoxide hydrolase [Mycobacterium sp. NAZ190054]
MTDDAPDPLLPTVTDDTTGSADTVQRFLFAMAEQDFDTFESLAAPDLVWQNVGLPTIRGRSRILKMLRRGEGKVGFLVKFHRIAADERSGAEQTGRGGTVLTERTDALIFGPLRLQFWVCGTFEVNDNGQITLWRDYFDYLDVMIKAPARAIAGLVVPSLRPSF